MQSFRIAVCVVANFLALGVAFAKTSLPIEATELNGHSNAESTDESKKAKPKSIKLGKKLGSSFESVSYESVQGGGGALCAWSVQNPNQARCVRTDTATLAGVQISLEDFGGKTQAVFMFDDRLSIGGVKKWILANHIADGMVRAFWKLQQITVSERKKDYQPEEVERIVVTGSRWYEYDYGGGGGGAGGAHISMDMLEPDAPGCDATSSCPKPETVRYKVFKAGCHFKYELIDVPRCGMKSTPQDRAICYSKAGDDLGTCISECGPSWE